MENTAFEQLKREYRHMELNRKAYADESHQVLRKQQINIEKLRRDNEALKTEMAMEMRNHATTKPMKHTDNITALHDEADRYTQYVEMEKRNIKVMEEQISLMRQKILHQRKVMGGVNAARDNQAMIQKQIRILENRLDKALVKFNEALAHNKKLRETIDDLRRERVVFDNIYRKLERELHDKKKQMANIIELSNLSYEQRDNSQMEIAAIEQANRKEQEDFEEQMLELGRLLEHDLKITTGPSSSGGALGSSAGGAPPRSPGGGSGALSKSGPGGGGPGSPGGASGAMDPHAGTLSAQEEGVLKKKVNKGAWGLAKDKVEIQVSVERVQNFEEAFNKIKAATGINDIEELVRTFIKNEDQNFSLFNYVNEQTNEIEKLEEQIQALQDEEAKYAHESGEDVNQHKQILKELEVKLQSTEGGVEKYESRCLEAQKTIESLKKGIESMFLKIECPGQADVIKDLVNEVTVNEANMLQFLGIIEQQCNLIIQEYGQVKAKESAAAAASSAADGGGDDGGKAMLNVLGIGPTTPMGQDLIHVNPPKLEDYSSEDEDEDEDEETRPLTREELKAKTLNRMHRRVNRDGTRATSKKGTRGGGGTGRR